MKKNEVLKYLYIIVIEDELTVNYLCVWCEIDFELLQIFLGCSFSVTTVANLL